MIISHKPKKKIRTFLFNLFYLLCHDPHDPKQQRRRAKTYFTEALSKADYYINDQELRGEMHGKLAERLEISPTANRDIFLLCARTDIRARVSA